MHVVLIVLGMLLVLFGGGCTLIVGGLVSYDSAGFWSDLGTILPMWIALGLAPLAGGIFLMRAGIRRGRELRREPAKGGDA